MIFDHIKNDIDIVWSTDFSQELEIIPKHEQEVIKNRLAHRFMLTVEVLVRDGYDLDEAYKQASVLLKTPPDSAEEKVQTDWESLNLSIKESGVF